MSQKKYPYNDGPYYSPKGGAAYDAFGRQRVSNPITVFDSKQIFDNQPLFWDDQQTSGSGTGSSHSTATASTTLSVGVAAGTRVRQTFMRFNYQPGKSQMILMTGVLDKSGGGTGITRCWGIFDDDNGLFLEDAAGTVSFVRRTKTTGSVVNNKTPIPATFADGTTIDWSKTQILVIDFEWLGVGKVRFGLARDGGIDYLHTEDGVNTLGVVYMSTPNLPLRYEIINDGNGVASSIEHICSTVISEGGQQDNGVLHYVSTGGTHVDANTQDTTYAVIGIRLKSASIGQSIDIETMGISIETASEIGEWTWLLNPTVAGTFTYSDHANANVQIATGATANTVTGGTPLTGGFASSTSGGGGSGGTSMPIPNALRLGAAIDGTVDEMVLCWTPRGGTNNHDVEGCITWRELA